MRVTLSDKTVTQSKRRWWVYVLLVFMLLALVGFSILPLLSSIAQQQTDDPAAVVASPSPNRSQLEAEASGYQLVLEREPNNETALRGLLKTRLNQGDFERATVPLEKMAQLHPEQADYAVLLAQVKQQLGDAQGAVNAYQTVLALQPGNFEALNQMTNLLLQQDRAEKAINLLQGTLKTALNGDSFDAEKFTLVQLLLGLVYERKERYSEAIALYDQIIATDPQDFRPLMAKALVLQKQGNEQAQALIDQAVSLAPPAYQEQIKALVNQAESDDAA